MTSFYAQGCVAAMKKLGFEFPSLSPKKEESTWYKIRKAGPAVGGLAGLLGGALLARRRPGHLLKHLVGGFGTGATIGWAPDVLSSGYEALRG